MIAAYASAQSATAAIKAITSPVASPARAGTTIASTSPISAIPVACNRHIRTERRSTGFSGSRSRAPATFDSPTFIARRLADTLGAGGLADGETRGVTADSARLPCWRPGRSTVIGRLLTVGRHHRHGLGRQTRPGQTRTAGSGGKSGRERKQLSLIHI